MYIVHNHTTTQPKGFNKLPMGYHGVTEKGGTQTNTHNLNLINHETKQPYATE